MEHASSAGTLARRTDGKAAKLRFAGKCTGAEHGTVKVVDDAKNVRYRNNGHDGEDVLTCTIIDENTSPFGCASKLNDPAGPRRIAPSRAGPAGPALTRASGERDAAAVPGGQVTPGVHQRCPQP